MGPPFKKMMWDAFRWTKYDSDGDCDWRYHGSLVAGETAAIEFLLTTYVEEGTAARFVFFSGKRKLARKIAERALRVNTRVTAARAAAGAWNGTFDTRPDPDSGGGPAGAPAQPLRQVSFAVAAAAEDTGSDACDSEEGDDAAPDATAAYGGLAEGEASDAD